MKSSNTETAGDGKHAHATPTKRFFVEMLTRDIALEDAILDLLDNCVDGVMRTLKKRSSKDRQRPYDGYWARISLGPDRFKIEDNCGGIDRDTAINYAFVMGRREDDDRDSDLPTVGMYGIGMKRAIFKLGRSCTVTSRTHDDAFAVSVPKAWLGDDLDWELPLGPAKNKTGSEPGTTIEVTELRKSVLDLFLPDRGFAGQLRSKIQSNFSLIIQKGFQIIVNEVPVVPRELVLLLDQGQGEHIAPYVYQGSRNGVHVEIIVGFYRPTPSEEDADEEQQTRHSSESAGWTIVCNDRVVVSCDKTRLTGWGEAGVPLYHPQFISIAGVVQFHSVHAETLPITTTKRGLDPASDLYLYVKDFMREGMKIFTSYTNRWKTRPKEERPDHRAKTAPAVEAPKRAKEWTKVRGSGEERKSVPRLPMPKDSSDQTYIRFSRQTKDIARLGWFFFEDRNTKPSVVGEECFDRMLLQVKK
jgi:hypothetical protein